MKKNRSFLVRALKDQNGQVLPWAAFLMILFLGFTGLVVDVGHAMFCQRELQASADAAALAAGRYLSQGGPTASLYAQLYSSKAGTTTINGVTTANYNIRPNMAGVALTTTPLCLTTVTGFGLPCDAAAGAYNAIQVHETVAIPTYFMTIMGQKVMNLQATATSTAHGTYTSPYNVVILVDTTASMTSTDSNCGDERITCALNGVQILLKNLSPCPAADSGTCAMTASQDRVNLMTFPNVTVGTATKDANCSGSPSIPVYSLPPIPQTTGTTASYNPTGSSTATYQITGFLNNYRTSDTATSLSTSSLLAQATGAKSGCDGLAAPGGDGTYYAGAIYAAQASLTAAAVAYPSTYPVPDPQNIMIILSDGEANADKTAMAAKTTDGLTSLGTTNSFPASGGATSSATNYPSVYDQCQQAVAAANWAKSQGTIIYTVAYGSESSGCTTDSSGPQKNITPCQVMAQMATDQNHFYSDYNQSGGGGTCIASTPAVDLDGIFGAISSSLETVRLIPDNTP